MAKTSGISQDIILQVAEGIFSAKGARETSLKDIAKAVGISKGTLYYHYSTKEALVYDLSGRHFDRVIQRMLRIADKLGKKTGAEELLTLLMEDLGDEKRISRLHLYLLHEVMGGNEELRQRYLQRHAEWQETVQIVLKRLFGETHDAHEKAAGLLLTFVEGNAIRCAVQEEAGAYREMARCIVAMYTDHGRGIWPLSENGED